MRGAAEGALAALPFAFAGSCSFYDSLSFACSLLKSCWVREQDEEEQPSKWRLVVLGARLSMPGGGLCARLALAFLVVKGGVSLIFAENVLFSRCPPRLVVKVAADR